MIMCLKTGEEVGVIEYGVMQEGDLPAASSDL